MLNPLRNLMGCLGSSNNITLPSQDYTGMDVTPKNFLKILRGENMTGVGSGKTLKSTKDDHVFVYFADHGAPGLIAFPRGELYAKDLMETIKFMYTKQTYQ